MKQKYLVINQRIKMLQVLLLIEAISASVFLEAASGRSVASCEEEEGAGPAELFGDAALKEEWEAWKTTHQKTYRHSREEGERSLIWLENKKFVDTHNSGVSSFVVAMNEFGDMTDEEWMNRNDDYTAIYNVSDTKPLHYSSTEKYPASVDWRKRNAVTPVKHQGQCKSAYAFAAVGALEGAYALVNNKDSNPPIPFSEQSIIDCSVPFGNHGCSGGEVRNAYQYIIAVGGINRAIIYHYNEKQGLCLSIDDSYMASISGVVNIKKGNEEDLLAAVATVGPVAALVDASSKAFRFYSSGVFDSVLCSSTKLNHAMVVIGYGTVTSNNKDYWIVKNSWGPSWGEGGYIRMSRNSYNQCGIATNAMYPTL